MVSCRGMAQRTLLLSAAFMSIYSVIGFAPQNGIFFGQQGALALRCRNSRRPPVPLAVSMGSGYILHEDGVWVTESSVRAKLYPPCATSAASRPSAPAPPSPRSSSPATAPTGSKQGSESDEKDVKDEGFVTAADRYQIQMAARKGGGNAAASGIAPPDMAVPASKPSGCADRKNGSVEGVYTDETEDRTMMEGQVTSPGERISQYADIVRPELIQDATADSDVTDEEWEKEYFRVYGCAPPKEQLVDDEIRGMEGWTAGTESGELGAAGEEEDEDDGEFLTVAERWVLQQNKMRRAGVSTGAGSEVMASLEASTPASMPPSAKSPLKLNSPPTLENDSKGEEKDESSMSSRIDKKNDDAKDKAHDGVKASSAVPENKGKKGKKNKKAKKGKNDNAESKDKVAEKKMRTAATEESTIMGDEKDVKDEGFVTAADRYQIQMAARKGGGNAAASGIAPPDMAVPASKPSGCADRKDGSVEGVYTDETEDRTMMEGQVTSPGERISQYADIVRPELIQDATADSDVTDEEWEKEYFRVYGCAPPKEQLVDDEIRGMEGWTAGTESGELGAAGEEEDEDDGEFLTVAERWVLQQNKMRRAGVSTGAGSEVMASLEASTPASMPPSAKSPLKLNSPKSTLRESKRSKPSEKPSSDDEDSQDGDASKF